MVTVLILADDLTGALDSGVAFQKKGMRTIVAVHPGAISDALGSAAEVVAVNTATRELSASAARIIYQKIIDDLGAGPEIIFKKIDSRLKGNIAEELKPLLSMREWLDVLICPAIPLQGRYVKAGHVVGMGVESPLNIQQKLPDELDFLSCPDVECLDDIACAFPDQMRKTLFVGAAGLAEAIANQLSNEQPRNADVLLQAPAVFAIGSKDPITDAQIIELSKTHIIHDAPNGSVGDLGALTAEAAQVMRMVPGKVGISSQKAGERFTLGVSVYLQNNIPATLLASGGETANGLLRRLDVDLVEVMGEFAPGIPISKCLGTYDSMLVLTKSGGFGHPKVLVDLMAVLQPKQMNLQE